MKIVLFLAVLIGCAFIVACSEEDSNPITPPNLSPTISGINPNSFAVGEKQVNMTITGTNLTGTTVVWLGDGITVHTVTVNSATSVGVKLSVQWQAVEGKRDISVTTPQGTARANQVLTVSGRAPEADFKVTPNGDIPQQTEVEFDGSLSTDDGSIQAYSWDFGDGKKGTGQKILHKYTEIGNYDAALTVTDNNGLKNTRIRPVKVVQKVEVECTQFSRNTGLLYGTVIDVEPGNIAVVKLDRPGSTCQNSFYVCGDMRDGEVDLGFYGIISKMTYIGDNTFKIKNDCPFKWPPPKNSRVFLFYKHCSNNFCA